MSESEVETPRQVYEHICKLVGPRVGGDIVLLCGAEDALREWRESIIAEIESMLEDSDEHRAAFLVRGHAGMEP